MILRTHFDNVMTWNQSFSLSHLFGSGYRVLVAMSLGHSEAAGASRLLQMNIHHLHHQYNAMMKMSTKKQVERYPGVNIGIVTTTVLLVFCLSQMHINL